MPTAEGVTDTEIVTTLCLGEHTVQVAGHARLTRLHAHGDSEDGRPDVYANGAAAVRSG